MKKLLSLITALAALPLVADDPPPADSTPAEAPLCVGFSFNNGAARSGGGATTVTKDTADTVKGKAFALEASDWFYAANAPKSNAALEFPFTPDEAAANPDASGGSSEGGSSGDTTPATKPTITWTSKGVYSTGRGTTTFLDGYLDDGEGVKITVSNFAHKYTDSKYDVIIYFATDTSNVKFEAPTVNGKRYTFDAQNPERAKEGSENFGSSTSLPSGWAQYGVNALRVCGLTGDLGITNAVPASTTVARGGIAAFQIVPAGHTPPVLTIGGADKTEVNWSDTANWTPNTVITTNSYVRVHLEGDATLTLDKDVIITNLSVTGQHTLTLKSASPAKSCSFARVWSSDASLALADAPATTNVAIDSIRMPLTIKAKANDSHIPFTSRSYPSLTFAGGAGTENNPVSYTCAGGYLTLKGEGENSETFYIKDENGKTSTANGTTVTFDGAKVTYKGNPGRFSVGNALFTLTNATVTAESLWLSQGADNRNARLTLDGKSILTVTGTTDANLNSSSVMFGHWNGPSTFTLNGESQFIANSQVLVGKTRNTHTINLNGGLFSATGIVLAGRASVSNTLNLNGGTLALGSVGLSGYQRESEGGSINATSDNFYTMSVNVTGDATLVAKEVTFPVRHPVTISADKTLTLEKTNTLAEAATYKFTKTISGEGQVLVKQGVNVQFGTARPKKLKLDDANSTLAFTLSTESGDEAVIQCEGLNSLDKVTIYHPNGADTVVTATYATLENNTLTIKPWQTLNCTEDGEISFEDASNWAGASSEAVPASGDILLKTVAGKTCTVTVGQNHSYGTIYVVGTGTVVLKGTGVLTPSGNVTVRTGATLTLASASVIAEGKQINLLSDSTLAILDLPAPGQFKNTITGEGKVETFGDVKFMQTSNYSGGLTVKRGTASVYSTGQQSGFGGAGNNSDAGRITVEDGGCLDLAHTWNRSYTITIAGKGVATTNENKVTYSGAIKNSATGFSYTRTQTKSLTLAADALITVDDGKPWGILASGFNATTLNFAGHTLTKQGAGEFFLCKVTTSSAGVLVIKEGKLTIYQHSSTQGGPSTLTNSKILLFGNSTMDFVTNLNGLNQLRFCPAPGGVTVNNINLLAASTQKILTGAGFDGNALGEISTDGGTVTLVKGTANTITNGFLSSISLGGRFKKEDGNANSFALTYSGIELTATLQAPTKFFHYDFNNATASQNDSAATDSVYKFSGWGDKTGNGPFIVNKGRSGKSAHIFFKNNTDRQTPYWDGTTAPVGALDSCGALTVTTVARLMCAGKGTPPIWGLGTLTRQGGSSVIGLVALDATTVAAVAVDSASGTGSAMRELARVTGIKDLKTAFHFFALVVTGEESRLYVDRLPPAVSFGASAPLNGMRNSGQFGGFRGGSTNYPRLASGSGGFYLDDFQVYDAILSDKEIQALRRTFCPDPFFMIVK